jgi:hypothetical protein
VRPAIQVVDPLLRHSQEPRRFLATRQGSTTGRTRGDSGAFEQCVSHLTGHRSAYKEHFPNSGPIVAGFGLSKNEVRGFAHAFAGNGISDRALVIDSPDRQLCFGPVVAYRGTKLKL